MKKTAGFLYAESGLVTPKIRIELAVARVLDSPVSLKRFIKGHGWGLKYLVFLKDRTEPQYLVKAASRVIERRLKKAQRKAYLQFERRFTQEAAVLNSLADIGFGPRVLLLESGFFLREYLPGACLPDLPQDQWSIRLPEILGAIDRICDSGIFHTDPNAGNVLVDPASGRVSFIDSEIPRNETSPTVIDSRRRAYCHERFLYTAGLECRRRRNLDRENFNRLVHSATGYYGQAANPALSPERAAALLEGRALQMELPS